jgi:hypothetical protein
MTGAEGRGAMVVLIDIGTACASSLKLLVKTIERQFCARARPFRLRTPPTHTSGQALTTSPRVVAYDALRNK